MEKLKILVADDELTVRQLLSRTLDKKKYAIETAKDGNAVLKKIKSDFFNLLITDLKMPETNGLDVLREIKKTNPHIEVIVITGYPAVESAVEAIKLGAFDYICKPFNVQEMASTVSKCLDKQKFAIGHIELSELMTLFEISKATATTSATSLNSVLEKILDSALKIVKAKRGSILLLDDKTREFSIKAARGLSDEIIKNTRIKFDESICGKVVKDGKPLLVTDIEQDNRFRRKNKSEYKTKSFISFLLQIKSLQKNVVGVINITDKISGENFTEREKALLSLLANQAGEVIENYRLYSQLQDKVKDLENTIAELNKTQNQLIQTEKMAAVGKLVFDIAHEIRNPLGIILSGVEFLKSNLADKADDITRNAIERITESVNRSNNIIIDFLKFSRVSKLDLTTINVCKLMDEAVSLIKNQADFKNISITKDYSEKDISCRADPVMLRQAFFNLCSNSIDAMPDGGRLMLNIYPEQKSKKAGKNVIVEVADTGKGIPPDILSKIFDPFFTTKEPGKGTGLGLSIVRMILDRNKGTINVKSEANKGTKFIIKLLSTPKA